MKCYRNTVTGTIRLTPPSEMDGWEVVEDPSQLKKASERILYRIEEIDADRRAEEEKLRKEIEAIAQSRIVNPNGATEEKKVEPISFRKLISGIAFGDWRGADYEREVCNFDGKAEQRVQSATDDATGGYLVPAQYLPASFIDYVRKESIADMLPVTRLEGLTSSPVEVGEQTGTATAYWTAENASITNSTVTVGRRSIEPHGLKCLAKMSTRSIRMTNPAIDSLIEQDLAAVAGLELSRAFIYGTGASNEPLGVRYTTGITATAMSAALAPAKLWNMVYAVEASDITIDSSAAFAMNSQQWNTLRQSTSVIQAGINRSTSGTAPIISKDLGGIPIHVSNQITATDVFFGVWRHAVIGRWGGVSIMASPHAGTAFQADQVWVRLTMDVDFMLRRPEAFCYDPSAHTS